ncbi:MAG TPA: hypothetical protein GXX34_03640 [Clostridia bacterium]|nr:hypothetical protein [Clostridia bacterium]
MVMRAIRNKRRALKVPLLIFTVVLSISLVGLFTYTPLDFNTSQPGVQASEVESLLDLQRHLEQALKLEPGNVELHVSLGNTLYDIGVYYAGYGDAGKAGRYFKEATVPYEQALEMDPSLIGARVDLATAAYYAGLDELAEKHFQEAVRREPDFVNGRINYGVFLFYRKEDPEAALEQWNAALALDLDPAVRSQVEAMVQMAQEAVKANN